MNMGCGKLILAFVLPPLAVLDCGLVAIVVTTILTILFWIPGIIAAFVFNARKPQAIQVNVYNQAPPPSQPE